MPRGVDGVIKLADDGVAAIDGLHGLQAIECIVHVGGAGAVGIAHRFPTAHRIIGVGGHLAVMIGDGIQAIEIIVDIICGRGVGAAAAGIGDGRLQQDTVTRFVVIVREYRAIGLGFGFQVIVGLRKDLFLFF